jgi:hypothetical protein
VGRQADLRIPSSRHGKAIGLEPERRAILHNVDGLQAPRSAMGFCDLGAEQQADTEAAKRRRKRGRNFSTWIDDGNDLGPRRAKILCRPPPII